MLLELAIEEDWLEIERLAAVRLVAVGLFVFKDSIEAAAKEEKEGVEEGVEEVVVELSITDPVGVLNEFESPVDVSEILELKFLEELEFIKEDKDAEDLTEV
jgi:hypothetical protein